ncbi:superoxide dismutase [Bacillus pinisoli]|uniref:superoxide dismutase n=1 Tax=Bacillus pinisoli TaxID=2901866 RepID=UPI001FF24609|nr:superoxide dismutase [Bacillus pinisoli]
MEHQKYMEYFQEVAQWAVQLKGLLVEFNLTAEPYLQLDQELSILTAKVEDLSSEGEVSTEGIDEVKGMVVTLFQKAQVLFGAERNVVNRRVPIGEHVLPPLPYPYDALEPYISEEIMKLHHDTHHQSYVDGLNKAEKMMEKARYTNNYDLLKHWEREAAFHGSGHYLHSIFWFIMKPNGGGLPVGGLLNQIKKDFGSFDRFKEHFTEAASKVEGVGWTLLVWSPRSHRLEILQTEKHQLMTQWDTIPLLVLDVWEHAYYLQYQADRNEYIKNWWNVVNWDEVEDRFDQASKLKWKPF